jgi:ABC-2 type transport system ATP-binding protein
MATLETINLCKRYRDFSLGPIDLNLEPGSVHGLIGANGAGKSTLFRCLLGLVRHDQGIIKLNGQLVDNATGRWKQAIGYVGDYTPLYENWSGARNLKTFARFYDDYSWETVQRMASNFDLDLDKLAKNYSTGQRTKLAIIHALAHGANFLLLDEPTAGLDPVARDTFMELLYDELGKEGITILYATHYVTEVERIADEFIIIADGKVLGHKVKEDLAQYWRRITFRCDRDLGELPNQVAVKVFDEQSPVLQGDDNPPNFDRDFEVISSNHESTLLFLDQSGARSIQTSRMSIEQICVQILKTRLGR